MNMYYKRDLDSNYLVVEDQEFERHRFSLRMLESNVLPSFLKLSLKQMNGFISLWYRVTSMHPVEQIFERRSMRGEDIRLLMGSLHSALMDVRSYLLEPEDIVLDPAYIFMTPDRNRVCFIYVPQYASVSEGSLKKLAEYILKKLDHKDPSAVEAGYELYDRIAGGQNGFSEIWEDLSGRIFGSVPDNMETKALEHTSVPPSMEASLDSLTWEDPPADGKPDGKVRTGSVGKYLLPAAVGVLLSGVLFWAAVRIWKLDATQLGGLFFGLLAAAWLAVGFVRGRNTPQRSFRDTDDETQEEQFWQALTSAEGIEVSDAVRQEASDAVGKPDFAAEIFRQEPEEEWIHGETRALGEVDRSSRLVLVSQDIRRSRDLAVESSICLIGKSREMADVCIPLDVISRVHARIDQTDEGIFLTDLNSMNGTFVNGGDRLPVHVRVRIREGDLVSFATVHFKVARRDY